MGTFTLPPSLTVERNEASEAALVDHVKAWLAKGERAEGVHVSDLPMPMKGYWRTVNPLPVTDREAGFFMVGKVLHAFILGEKGAPVDLSSTDEGSQYDPEMGLWYSIDKLVDGEPIEFKTSRSMYEPKSVKDLETYLDQLLPYMAIRKSTRGWLWVFYVSLKDANSGKTTPQFRVYEVNVTPAELEALRLEVRRLRDSVADAVRTKNPSVLPLCPEWACSPDACGHWDICRPLGRHNVNSYLASKRG